MPAYEYECDACKQTVVVEQKLTDLPLERCPLYEPDGPCGGALRRIIPSSTNFILTGKGWAKDGYGK